MGSAADRQSQRWMRPARTGSGPAPAADTALLVLRLCELRLLRRLLVLRLLVLRLRNRGRLRRLFFFGRRLAQLHDDRRVAKLQLVAGLEASLVDLLPVQDR